MLASALKNRPLPGCSAGVKPYVEVAFLHKASKTLLVTDALISISPEAPEVQLQAIQCTSLHMSAQACLRDTAVQ